MKNFIATVGNKQALYHKNIPRYDIGIPVPDDGYEYVMPQHEIILFGKTRHASNKPNDRVPRPAIVNNNWGLRTSDNRESSEINPPWQHWFKDFWDYFSGEILPLGKAEGTYTLPKNNQDVIYTRYTKGSLLELYAGMIGDAVAFTDALAPETGGWCDVTKRNVGAKRYWQWLHCMCTGALLRVIGRNGTRLKIEAINLFGVLPDISKLPIHLFFYCTQVDTKGNVTRFPQIKNAIEVHGYSPIGTPAPLIAPDGYFWIDRKMCVELKPGQIWQPYYRV